MQKKLPYILAIVLPFLVVWPLSVILLPQAQTKLHLWVIGIALFIVIFFAVWRGELFQALQAGLAAPERGHDRFCPSVLGDRHN